MSPTLSAGAPTAFAATYPVDLVLSNSGLPVLYLNFTSSQTLQFQISNVSSSNFAFPPQSAPASAGAYQMYLALQPGVIDNTQLGALSLAESGWSFVAQADPDGGTDLYVASPAGLPFAMGAQVTLTLQNIRMAPAANLSLTQVGLAFQLMNTDTQTAVSGSRTAFLQLAPSGQNALNAAPIWFGCDSANTVVNDDRTVNSLSLLIANRAAAAPLTLTPSPAANPTSFTLSFDVQGTGESRPWALATTSQVQGITVESVSPDWAVAFDSESAVPQWTITTTASSLAAGTSLQLALDGIVTGLPNGPATAYLTYANLPGHSNGQFTATIEKGPVSIASAAVAVGATAQSNGNPLQVVGNVQAAGFLLANGVSVVPSGTIVMWWGGTVPNGWQLCDGTNGTPNLASHFIVATGPNPGNGQPMYQSGDSGGFDAHTHSGSTAPQSNVGGTNKQGHHHHISASPVCFTSGESGTTPGNCGSYVPNVWNTSGDLNTDHQGGHSHVLDLPSLSFTTENDGGAGYYNRPAWFALAFIMKL